MDPNALSRKAIDGIRAAQVILVAVATAVPSLGLTGDDVDSGVEATIGVVSAVAALAAVLLGILTRKNVTPLSSPRNNEGLPLTRPGQ